MKRLYRFVFIAFIFPTLALAQTYPEYEELYVNDFGNLLTALEEREIRADLKELRDKRGIEFTVVTIASMSRYQHVADIEPFATGLFNKWGVGNADRNDGVMMLVSRNDRKMRIEVGSGYGTSKNAPMKRIIDRTITPQFKEGDYAGGISDGVEAVIFNLVGEYPGEIDGTPLQKAKGWASRTIEFFKWMIWPLSAGTGVFGFWVFRRWLRYRPRRCPRDHNNMILLAEHWDDEHLKQGERTEEELESVDYDVWFCETCEHITIEAYKKWSSRYSACRKCGYKTLQGDTFILSRATTSSTGSKRIDYSCHNCDEAYSVTKVIPKVSKSSSSSSSGGSSSFGGGSSSGGGASGSW
ncbi:MAG: YgcG family protein [Roseovarius sp.]